MIRSKADYRFFLEADKRSLRKKSKRPKMFRDEIWRYQRLLRKLEYYINCKGKNSIYKPYIYYLRWRHRKLSLRLGFEIHANTFGPGLNIAHIGNIVVNPKAKIGRNCRVHVGVNIGVAAGTRDEVPIIGDNVYIGPGAKLFGAVKIADDIAIGANAVVNKSFDERSITIGGIPAKKISEKGSQGLFVRGAE